MENTAKTSAEGTQTGTQGAQNQQNDKTFTQEDVNRIVQERLAKERSKGNNTDELIQRTAELDLRERKIKAREELSKNGLPDYLVDALNMQDDESLEKSIKAITKMKGEAGASQVGQIGGTIISPIGNVEGTGAVGDPLRKAFGLE